MLLLFPIIPYYFSYFLVFLSHLFSMAALDMAIQTASSLLVTVKGPYEDVQTLYIGARPAL